MTREILLLLGIAAGLCGSVALWVLSPRLSAVLVFALLLLALAAFPLHRRKYVVAGIWALYLLALSLPVDIAFSHKPGLNPRLVSVLYGLPGPEAQALADKGEVVLGGCIVLPNSPKWVLLL